MSVIQTGNMERRYGGLLNVGSCLVVVDEVVVVMFHVDSYWRPPVLAGPPNLDSIMNAPIDRCNLDRPCANATEIVSHRGTFDTANSQKVM